MRLSAQGVNVPFRETPERFASVACRLSARIAARVGDAEFVMSERLDAPFAFAPGVGQGRCSARNSSDGPTRDFLPYADLQTRRAQRPAPAHAIRTA